MIAINTFCFVCSGSDEENEELFSWEEYLKKCHAKAVPKETFKHVSFVASPSFQSHLGDNSNHKH